MHPDGYVEIRDRLKDVIISGGENISSVEVEGVLLRHPAVQEVAVVGLPDTRNGARRRTRSLSSSRGLRRRRTNSHVHAHRLAHFKRPHTVTFVADLPKTATGKIQKFVLRGNRAAIAQQ